jgi:DnaJ-class molecular chaperone
VGAPPSGPGLSASQLAELEAIGNMMQHLDYFQLLKISPEAAPAQVKKAFYQESRSYHPDRFYHLDNKELKTLVNDVYKRITEAYAVLRDDQKRRKYAADVAGPEREQKLRFTENSETETKQQAKKEAEEQIGTHPKGRQFFQTGMQDFDAGRWSAAERNFKMALTYEPSNARYKEKLTEAQNKIQGDSKSSGGSFKIR